MNFLLMQERNMNKIKIGISKCLLGENVRYDGGHKLDKYLRDVLGQFVDYVAACPENDCGLPIPREAVRLVMVDGEVQLRTSKTNIDHSKKMQEWANEYFKFLEKEEICGYIFKINSPSSGMRSIKIYNKKGYVQEKGIGFFAKMFMERFPNVPVEDEGRMNDDRIRQNFIERIFIYSRWLECKKAKSLKALMDFQTSHKLVLMAHSNKLLKQMGPLIACYNKKNIDQTLIDYEKLLLEAIKLIVTIKKNTNVLEHCAGYFKKHIDSQEKQELASLIKQYHDDLIPLIVPITLINHYVSKYNIDYLSNQWYLKPHPSELKLLNRV